MTVPSDAGQCECCALERDVERAECGHWFCSMCRILGHDTPCDFRTGHRRAIDQGPSVTTFYGSCGKTVQLAGGAFHHGRIVTCHAPPDHAEQHRGVTTGMLPDGTEVEVAARWSEPWKES